MLRARRPGVLPFPKLLAFAALAAATMQAALFARPKDSVPEIRFGLIEPPVVAQRDITVNAPTSNRQAQQTPLECSGMAWVAGQLIISSDRHGHLLFSCRVDLKDMTIGEPVPHVVIGNEQYLLDDAESLAAKVDANGLVSLYAMCSLSNDPAELPLPKRRHMMRLSWNQSRIDWQGQPVVISAGPIREALNQHFEAVGIEPYRTFHAEFTGPDKNTYRWGNVEGIAFAPDGIHLLCGMRNPLFEQKALLFAVRGVPEAFDSRSSDRLVLSDLFTLDLGQRGVSDLCWDPLTQGYLITAARSNGPKIGKDQPFPPNTLDSALFWWSGRKSDAPRLVATVPEMKIEAICRLGSSRYIAIGSDEGDVSESRPNRQSVLTILYFAGFAPDGEGGIQ